MSLEAPDRPPAGSTDSDSLQEPDVAPTRLVPTRRSGRAATLALLLLLTGATGLRAAPGDPDPTFNTGNGLINGRTLRVILQPDGKPLIGGLFSTVNGATRPGFARLNSDGTTDLDYGGPGSGQVQSMARQSDGKVLLGGGSGVYRVDANGMFDQEFGFIFTNGEVLGLRVLSTGKIMIGGAFSTVGGIERNKLARLNSDGTLDTDFTTVTGGFQDYVFEFFEQSDGKILVGGEFTNIGGVNRTRIARLESDGTVDTGFLDGPSGADGVVRSIAVQPDGKVLIGGLFGTVNGEARPGVARLNGDGELDAGFVANLNGTLNSVVLLNDGKVLVGGEFHMSGDGGAIFNIARLNSDGSRDPGFLDGLPGANRGQDTPLSYYGSVDTIAVQTDGRLVIVGDFTFVNGVARNHVARLNGDGSLDAAFDNGSKGLNGAVMSLATRADGRVVVGGVFNSVDGQPRNHIARLNTDGSLDTGFLNGLSGTENVSGGNGPVRGQVDSIAVDGDKTLIAGFFDRVNGVTRASIARLNDDGSVDTSFLNANTGVGFGSWASLVVMQSDGKILIGGNFLTFDGVSRGKIARLNDDGTLDTTFLDGMAGADSNVLAIVEQEDGRLLVGGLFTTFNGVTHRGLVRLNTDGGVDETFMNGLAGLASGFGGAPNPSVNAIALQGDGKIVIGGRFTTVHGVPRDRVARLNADGSLDPGFDATVSGDSNPVQALAVQADGKVLVGGTFFPAMGLRYGMVRFNGDGSVDDAFFDGQSGVQDSVNALLLQENGGVLVGGDFRTVNGVPRLGVVRLLGVEGTPPIRLASPTIGEDGVSFSVTGNPGETFDIQRAPSPTGPWNTIGTVELDQDGAGSFEDTTFPSDQAYYLMVRF